jgi:hypothetical protein
MTDESPGAGSDGVPDRAAIRAELEQVRADYHELLGSLSESDWKTKSANPAWKVGQLMWHLGFGMDFFSQAVPQCRRGKAPNPPGFLIDPVNNLMTRFMSRGATPESVSEKYDAAHATLLALLDEIQDDEWQKGVTTYGTWYTVESAFHGPRVHFEEHQADILQGLGRA